MNNIYFMAPPVILWPARQLLVGAGIPRRIDLRINFITKKQVTKSESRLGRVWKQAKNGLVTLVLTVSLISTLIVFGPKLYYSLVPTQLPNIQIPEAVSVVEENGNQEESPAQVETAYQPEQDPNLPEGEWLVIPRIGVRTNLIQTADPVEALNKGVWWAPDFGKPGDKDKPMILAAHRYGFRYMWETILDNGDTYALRHIFYKLPETEPGDRVEIIFNQRRYVYEIYAGEETNQINDYDADLILYTCKYIDAPIRFVRYARLVEPGSDTQTNSQTLSQADYAN